MPADTTARITLINLLLLAEPLADRLGPDWTRIETTPDPKTIQYGHTTGTVLGIRHLWDGAAAQTYVQIDGEPTYHAGVTFREDTSVDGSLMDVITTRLLPAMDGHRPKLRQNGTPHPPKDAAPDETPATGEQQHTEPDAPQPTPTKADQPDPTPAASEPQAQEPPKAAPAPKARPRAKKAAASTPPAAAKKTTPRRTTPRKAKASTTA
ncbi:hypothetical protein AW27_023025 [Streptomyces sp. PCS3-D2]|uniref:hypothetical protein n=1 Tax=Streptomyces sp. PCS3-D2 TaxID=1460244 RepID=UPI000451DDA2|nr:hypothetical protein [Streptomyces sp. PCS3-D2]WKV74118.1 hypothetical protein AW27_023025 [Streptomyces sp. PCS3-D2]